ncbi:hypothetical protein [Variovorax sp. UC122_21]|uniref:hypothetical protein n=1 Tax=Variovorax sp. UC122_21 TaxID=3374554 RepID=UPI00375758D4
MSAASDIGLSVRMPTLPWSCAGMSHSAEAKMVLSAYLPLACSALMRGTWYLAMPSENGICAGRVRPSLS